VIHGMGDLNGQPAPQHELVAFLTKGRFTFAGNRPKSVIRTVRVDADSMIHPNEKPVALMRALIRDYSKGGPVLDPFCGTGAVGVACAELGRDFVGIELDEGYCKIARQRIEAATRVGKLDF
jgi:site-specific DNA-methyltransferase (adenine-specific)